MNKLFLIFIIIINKINIYHCLGITDITKVNSAYIINIASEDIKIFEQKLENRFNSLSNEFKIIVTKVFLSTITPCILFFFYRIFTKKFFLKQHFLVFFIVLLCDFLYIKYIWTDYKGGIQSVKNAIKKLYIVMDKNYRIERTKSNFKEGRYKINYLSDEIQKYGIQAIFCEIPGTLPSNNADPLSYSDTLGGLCYNYKSQRRYLDPEADDYVGDEESQKYRIIQINKTFDLF
jgi:hypothetical protein